MKTLFSTIVFALSLLDYAYPNFLPGQNQNQGYVFTHMLESQNSHKILKTAYRPPIIVHPGTNIQAQVDQNPEGSRFLIKAGVHRLQQIKPKNGNEFIGEPGAILSGAKLLKQFQKEGQYWVAVDQFQKNPVQGPCNGGPLTIPKGGCKFSEDLFIDDTPLLQVPQLSDVGPGRWFFDYNANKIYFFDDPRNRKVETSVTRYAFVGPAGNVTIWRLTIEKYANPSAEGAIQAMNGDQGPLAESWTVRNNEVRFNHGYGIRLGRGMRIFQNHIHHNGQLGIGGAGEQILIEHNEISYNNTQGFNWLLEGGGVKLVNTQDVTLRGNYVHHNVGPGLWADVDNVNILYEENRTADNDGPGIFHEKSQRAVIRNNWSGRNGFGYPTWLVGAGILVSASSDVEIYGNTVWNNADGIGVVQGTQAVGKFGPHEVENIFIHDNSISMATGHTGLAVKSQDPSFFLNRNIRFERNTYVLIGEEKGKFRWMNKILSETQWEAFGHDNGGAFIRTQ
ncbi:MAG: right-handed parallel beta-helix repeat-containing protein [Nitrospira sp.]|nr:right-handed parallel beta-helix repeat-containing protein [Nitrospira sp.]HBP89349.1 right-handed parallel beta-helix repeat-containing protein [Nitrospiraceae bacterium]HNP27950.1 right-handed parallel beta-helix repeat-containing protein [Nitrospirales bacterium]